MIKIKDYVTQCIGIRKLETDKYPLKHKVYILHNTVECWNIHYTGFEIDGHADYVTKLCRIGECYNSDYVWCSLSPNYLYVSLLM